MINQKRCKKCGEIYDIGTNFDICPRCRGCKDIPKIDIRSVDWE